MKKIVSSTFFRYAVLYAFFFCFFHYYFYDCRTQTVYGDDLAVLKEQAESKSFTDVLGVGKIAFKFRPVSTVVQAIEIHFFSKTESDYFRFNVAVQALIALVFTAIAQMFLRSLLLSALLAILIGATRFAFYNIVQLMCGGPLEGLAMFLFLLTLYHVVVYLTYPSQEKKRSPYFYLCMALVFANLAVYSHERYMVMFPMIVIVAFFHPRKNLLSRKQKLTLTLFAFLSLLVNYVLKVYCYHYPFLLGTATSSIAHDFNIKMQLQFLGQALSSIVQLNSGAEYQIGIEYGHVTGVHYYLIMASVVVIFVFIAWYTLSNLKASRRRSAEFSTSLKTIILLLLIFGATLAPAVSTIDLAQRWFQAPLAVLMLVICVAYSYIRTALPAKIVAFVLFVILFQTSDRMYLTTLNKVIWMKGSEWIAACFRQLSAEYNLRWDTRTIYIVEDKRDGTIETGLRWTLFNGYFFDFYQDKSKKIEFLDSNMFKDSVQLQYLVNFNEKTEQIVIYKNGIFMYTNNILELRNKYFAEHNITAKNK